MIPKPTRHLKLVSSKPAPVPDEPADEKLEERRAKELMAGVGERLKRAIKDADTSAYALDKSTGIGNGRAIALAKEMRLARLSVPVAILYARALGVSLDYLLTGEEPLSQYVPLRKRDEWRPVFAEAFMRWGKDFPPAVWDELEEVALPKGKPLTPELLHGLAKGLAAGSVENKPALPIEKKRSVVS